MTTHASWISSVITIVTLVLVTSIVWSQIRLISRKLAIPEGEKKRVELVSGVALFGWLALSLALAVLDFYHVTPGFITPAVPIAFLLPLFVGYRLLRDSSTFRSIADEFPQKWLMLLQLPRVGGVVFLLLYQQGLLPALFAIPSGYGDLIVGLSAPVVAYLYSPQKPWTRWLAIAWNAVGILDLIIAIATGVLHAIPAPFRFDAGNPATEIMTVFPLVMIPIFAVPLGFLLHVFSLRLLLKENTAIRKAR